ncbi:septum site-determining protein MinC [Liquorilactobacillus satsumensis]|uniref:Probable septum site-determining protein MinC n=1 Tax=Liquorilactobacillus satsumensis DSM 16230 = JCM 12392 TaxID=1423801 RepID=A0A0R1V402_9LACO|nr:septum site-determining protein MinC [Liquorilactobacillus satsumensis]KRL97992.1 cell division inhibitor [Liquorilactobacillus satsumensis DSM 16230 = JCM 12392]MCC7667516.1 cell division inhibitor [Liquorilactobacillus satsumensis]MCP9312343.1 cell division inhibitor [Liquorilactobacillus satsumensis]MCP9327682.1 cell division inhibitor [Liquorilactobacillus satsumensis]MCP9357047.1 cell division inhibitor [Liquorilactobacillus satsumensis]
MQSVVLKGHQDGYVINLKADAKFVDILRELTELFEQLQQDKKMDSEPLSFNITTGMRLLDATEKQKIEEIVSRYPLFSIHKITSEVMRVQDALEMIESKSIHLNANTIRNGQVEHVKGDVLFIGNLHQGGMLRATGNVFLLGRCEGIVHAGYPSNAEAIIVGNVHAAQQVRIADAVAIVAQEQVADDEGTVVYVNDLHVLDYTKHTEVKTIRPKLFARMGGY